jgi:hypothetical protein
VLPMRNTDAPASNHKKPKLSSELSRFTEGMGVYFQNQGIPRIGGRVLGLLMIAHEPLSAEEIGSILKVSRGSISTNFRLLIASGMVEKVTFHGDRTTYFKFSESALEQRMAVGINGAIAFKKLMQQGLVALPPGNIARGHLERSIEWSDLIVESF